MYYGEHRDVRAKNKPAFAAKTLTPDFSLGAHTASLGLSFYTDDAFPAKYRNGAFIAQHGSWNRSRLSGYKVVFVPFENGKPSGEMEDFMSFMADVKKDKVYGRPVGVTLTPDGALLITDDVNGMVWRVSVSQSTEPVK
jgi:glucose/arabinose dehydrogenase